MPDSGTAATALVLQASRSRLVALVLWFVAACVLFLPTLQSMVRIWTTSETFAHGFIVAPISFWLAWRLRQRLLPLLSGGPSPPVLLLMLPLLPLWLAAQLVDVQVVQQLAFVAVLIVGLTAIMGWPAAKAAAFPLGFLLLAVPMGLSLESPMMDLTAVYTVKLIQLTGIPVYQEGRFFQLPSGSWSVVEACSGVRYLIASVTLGLIYAHLSYRSIGRKLAFVVASVAVPVVANVLRAYLIVMLGHLSGMRLATGVDHLIYGWVFFGLVMLLLFWIGGFWADGGATMETDSPAQQSTAVPAGWGTLLLAMALVAPVVLLGSRATGDTEGLKPGIFAPALAADWRCQAGDAFPWQPRVDVADRRLQLSCRVSDSGLAPVALIADQYFTGREGADVAGYYSQVIGDEGWRVLAASQQNVATDDDQSLTVEEAMLRGDSGQQVLLWSWYLVADDSTHSRARVKLLQAWQRLRGEPYIATRVYLGVMLGEEGADTGRDRLRAFLRTNVRAVNRALSATEPLP